MAEPCMQEVLRDLQATIRQLPEDLRSIFTRPPSRPAADGGEAGEGQVPAAGFFGPAGGPPDAFGEFAGGMFGQFAASFRRLVPEVGRFSDVLAKTTLGLAQSGALGDEGKRHVGTFSEFLSFLAPGSPFALAAKQSAEKDRATAAALKQQAGTPAPVPTPAATIAHGLGAAAAAAFSATAATPPVSPMGVGVRASKGEAEPGRAVELPASGDPMAAIARGIGAAAAQAFASPNVRQAPGPVPLPTAPSSSEVIARGIGAAAAQAFASPNVRQAPGPVPLPTAPSSSEVITRGIGAAAAQAIAASPAASPGTVTAASHVTTGGLHPLASVVGQGLGRAAAAALGRAGVGVAAGAGAGAGAATGGVAGAGLGTAAAGMAARAAGTAAGAAAGAAGAGMMAGPLGAAAALIGTEFVAMLRSAIANLRSFGEQVNDSNRILAAYNPTIAASFAMLGIGDMGRNIASGRELQASVVGLATSVNTMRDAWLGFDNTASRVRNEAAQVAAGASTMFGKFLSLATAPAKAAIDYADPTGAGAFRAGAMGAGGLIGGTFAGPAGAAAGAAAGAWVAAHRKDPAVANPWSQALHDISTMGPLVARRRVPPP